MEKNLIQQKCVFAGGLIQFIISAKINFFRYRVIQNDSSITILRGTLLFLPRERVL